MSNCKKIICFAKFPRNEVQICTTSLAKISSGMPPAFANQQLVISLHGLLDLKID